MTKKLTFRKQYRLNAAIDKAATLAREALALLHADIESGYPITSNEESILREVENALSQLCIKYNAYLREYPSAINHN